MVRDAVWPPNRGWCPHCDERLQFHGKSAWCLRCGWAKNREHMPGKPT